MDRIRKDVPDVHGYQIRDSSNVLYVGWQRGDMIVAFKGHPVPRLYRYIGVSRQRVVACALAKSVGEYVSRVIKPNFKVRRMA